MKRSILSMAAVPVLAAGLVLSGCQLLIGPSTQPINNGNNNNTTGTTVPNNGTNNGTNNGGPTTGTTSFSVNLTGAKALVTKTASTKSLGRGFQSRAITDSPLAKILEDGSVANVIQTDSGTPALPNIKFIAVSPTGDVFVYFEWSFSVPSADGKGTQQAQFIKLRSDNKYEVVEANAYINDFAWNYGAGAAQKPVVFNDDGSIFYATSGQTGTTLKRYFDGQTKELTATDAKANIEAFFTDGTNLYFVARNNSETNKAYFLRMVPPDGTGSKNVFYSASQDGLWVRSCKRVGDSLYVQGWGIPAVDAAGVSQTYNGLIQYTKDASNNFSAKLIVGYSNSGVAGNVSNYQLKGTIFNKADGTPDTATLNAIVRPFFTGGVVPSGIDFFKTITIDRNDTSYINDFASSDEAMFWYLLLKGQTGFMTKDTFISTVMYVNGQSKRFNFFQQSLPERLVNLLFTTTNTSFYSPPSSST